LHWDTNVWQHIKGETPVEKEDISFEKYLHLENNDSYDYSHRVQGLIALEDTPITNGGFCAVIGFGNRLQKWAVENTDLENKYIYKHFVKVPRTDPIHSEIRYVGARAGCLIVWNVTLPHSNFPNSGSQFRFCQYIKMFPAPKNTVVKELAQYIPKDLEVTDLGKKIISTKPILLSVVM